MLLSLPSAAQVSVGDEVSLTGSGTVSAGFNDSYGNQIESSHSLGIGGTAAVNGFYYDPNFLSFSVDPYYNQSRNNSNFASVTNASGVTLSSAIFSGSHFPGSINYSSNYNTTGNYGIPGIASLNTNGNSQNFGIGWSEIVPGLPTLSFGYQQGNSNYSLYGTNENGASNFNSFYLNSSYNIAGFSLGGGVSHGTSNALIPGVVIGGQTANSSSDSTSYIFNATHALPWSGTFTSNFNRTNLNSDYLGYAFNGNIDLVNMNASVNPTPKLNFSLGMNYTDNLSGTLYQALIPGSSPNTLATGAAGVVQNQSTQATPTAAGVLPSSANQSSSGWDVLFSSTYSFAANLQLQGEFERQEQTFLGENYGSNLYSAGVYYTRQIAGGYLGSSVSIIDSTVDSSSENELGFNVTTNYNRKIGTWQVGGYFNYAQNVQTFLVSYTTSFYNFSGNISRTFGRWFWSAGAGGGRTALVAVPNSSSSSESYTTSLGTNKFVFSGNYSKSDGNSLASGGGLVPTPLPPIVPSSLIVMYGGTSYGLGASVAPVRNFEAAANYVKSKDNLTNLGVFSWNNYEQENLYLQYQFRQIGINGGWTRLVQGFSASGTAPASFASFYIGVYRWFNFF